MDLLTALFELISALGVFAWQLLLSILPWTPLLAWIAFWTLAVNWRRLRDAQLRGGVIGIILLRLTAVLVWGVVAPPEGGTHSLLGLQVGNFTGKLVYVTALLVIVQLCGAVQLSGCCDQLVCLEQAPTGDDGHGYDHRGGDYHLGGHGHGGGH